MKWETISLDPTCSVHVFNKQIELSSNVKDQIEHIWYVKKQAFPNLFNGRIFTVTSLSPHQITGYWTEYKYALAQMENREFYNTLLLQPLAVTGLICCKDGFILGKRSQKAIYLPNYWQSAPAGNVESRHEENAVDLYQQLFIEAKEELGLEQELFSTIHILNATIHPRTHITDIGMMLHTNLSFQQIYKYWQENQNTEYDELICIADVTSIPKPLVPSTQLLINESNLY